MIAFGFFAIILFVSAPGESYLFKPYNFNFNNSPQFLSTRGMRWKHHRANQELFFTKREIGPLRAVMSGDNGYKKIEGSNMNINEKPSSVKPMQRRRGRPRKGEKRSGTSESLSNRLARATAAAISTSEAAKKNKKLASKNARIGIENMQSSNASSKWGGIMKKPRKDNLPIGSLSQLTKVLDKKLHSQGARGAGGDYPALDGLFQHPRDSMSSLLGHNYLKGDWKDRTSVSTRNVAIVFGKDLVRDQVTVEYASRIRTLVKLLKNEPGLFSPSLICFCGGISDGNHVSNADAGYIFFRHMCEAQNVDLGGIEIFIERKSKNEGQALNYCTKEVRKYLPQWLEVSPYVYTTDSSIPSQKMGRRKSKKVHVHFSLVSTEYHLCNLNDVYHRSPQQSIMKELEVLANDSQSYNSPSRNTGNSGYLGIYNDYDADVQLDDESLYYSNEDEMPIRQEAKGVVETSWSFQYATYPFVYAKDEVTVFLGKCFLLNEELLPLYANMKGVIEKKEFFQRDNYKMLASIRRSLVSHVEDLYVDRQVLRRALNISPKSESPFKTPASDARLVEEVLEGALLHLGRCIDLVRPAGLHVSSVPRSDWERAFRALERSMSEIRLVCDPDRPLRPSEWGKLMDKESVMLETSRVKETHENEVDESTELITESVSDDEEDNEN